MTLLIFVTVAATADKLSAVEEDVSQNYPSVDHLETSEFLRLNEEKVVLFDVREEDEFAVSHLPGAVQIDPDLTGEKFLAKYGDFLSNQKRAVFYCSVGVRSSEMAIRVRKAMGGNEVANLHNLQGGIFRWHNESLPLAKGNNPTDFVHPYNWRWGRLVNRSDLIRYDPE
ncbi:rhodanese-like domain-containing protein [Alphaproteobacteria bacterium]|nr:rhodanese-like domain-containing protein [Alphaproteobacteria bacterium]